MHNLSEYSLIQTHYKWIIILVVGLLITGCSNKKVIRPGDTLEEAFKKAVNMYEKKEYPEAISAFETVISIGRGTDIGREAQFLLAETYYKNEQYLLAASEYERFGTLYPQSDQKQDADFKQALCYYELSPEYKLSQKHTRRAIELFELFISRYPDSERVDKATEYIDQMRAKLARKMYESARLYQRVDKYEAAAIYYGLTTERYPETKWAEQALVKQIFAYIQFARRSVQSKRVERYQKAISSYEQYLQLFPEGEHREQAEKYLNTAEEELAPLDTEKQQSLSNSSASRNNSDNS